MSSSAPLHEPLNEAERAVDDLLVRAHVLAAHELPALVAEHGRRLGVARVVLYLADIQQVSLVPFLGSGGAGEDETWRVLGVDGTVAGRAFQQVQVLTQDVDRGHVRSGFPCSTAATASGC